MINASAKTVYYIIVLVLIVILSACVPWGGFRIINLTKSRLYHERYFAITADGSLLAAERYENERMADALTKKGKLPRGIRPLLFTAQGTHKVEIPVMDTLNCSVRRFSPDGKQLLVVVTPRSRHVNPGFIIVPVQKKYSKPIEYNDILNRPKAPNGELLRPYWISNRLTFLSTNTIQELERVFIGIGGNRHYTEGPLYYSEFIPVADMKHMVFNGMMVVSKRDGGDSEELFRDVWPGSLYWNPDTSLFSVIRLIEKAPGSYSMTVWVGDASLKHIRRVPLRMGQIYETAWSPTEKNVLYVSLAKAVKRKKYWDGNAEIYKIIIK